MSLLSRTKQLLASGNLSAALIITPLPATLASADVTINNDASVDFKNTGVELYSGAIHTRRHR